MSREKQTTAQVPPVKDSGQFAFAMLLASLLKPDSAAQSLTAAIDALVGETEEPFLASLTDDDYERLTACLDKLIDVVGENKKPKTK